MASRTNRLLKLLLAFCAVGAACGWVASSQGVEAGDFVVMTMMAIATFPMFHFASRWPLKK